MTGPSRRRMLRAAIGGGAGEGFRNSILGGVGQLVRTFIQSPNYVPGVSGWTINKDGSAEFNNATFRGTVIIDSVTQALLVYDGIPAAGNLILAISPSFGTDAYGNNFDTGLSLAGHGSNFGLFWRTSGLNASALVSAYIATGDPTLHIQGVPTSTVSFDSIDVRVGSGAAGRYYYEEVALPAQVVASGTAAVTIINLIAQQLLSNYGSQFNLGTGVWTCPITGIYEWTLSAAFAAWVAASRMILYASRNGTAQTSSFMTFDVGNMTIGRATVSARKYFTAGDTVALRIAQTTAANQTIDHAGAPELCYASVRRCL